MRSDSPELSVIMPAFNASPYIREAMDSILNQTFSNFELLIADDGSTDDTRKIIDSYQDQRIIKSHNSSNQGKTSTVNRLFKETKGAFITIHDADDTSFPSRFETQLNAFKKNPVLVLSGTNYSGIDTHGKELGKANLLPGNEEIKRNLFLESQFHGPTLIFKRSVAATLGEIYRPFFKDYNEDYDFSFRMSELGEVMNCEQYLYAYRITPNSLSRKLTVQKRISMKIVQRLAHQRKETGSDDLISGNMAALEEELKKLSQAYVQDKSLLYREQAELDLYHRFYPNALMNAFRAVGQEPMKFKNYRLVQHILRKRLFRF